MKTTEVIRLALAKQEKCSLPCACHSRPHPNDCQSRAREIETQLETAGYCITTPDRLRGD